MPSAMLTELCITKNTARLNLDSLFAIRVITPDAGIPDIFSSELKPTTTATWFNVVVINGQGERTVRVGIY